MAGLTGKTIASAYKSLLRIDDDAQGIDTTVERVTDGEGTKSALILSDDAVFVVPNNDNLTSTFGVQNVGTTMLFAVDTTNSVVKAGVGQFNVLTQYAHFHMNSTWWVSAVADTHYPMAFNSNVIVALTSFGTGTDPATTFTTAEGAGTRSAELVSNLWYIPDNIYIDSITSIEGADAASGDTTRMHLMQYTFNSGSTSALTSGALVAHSSDQVNAGSEQAYKNDWTVDDPTVSSGKVILAFFEVAADVNSDYSANVYIKYHLV